MRTCNCLQGIRADGGRVQHLVKMLLLLVPASTGLAARATVGRHQQLRMMASECPRLPEPEQSEQRQTATFAMG